MITLNNLLMYFHVNHLKKKMKDLYRKQSQNKLLCKHYIYSSRVDDDEDVI